MYSKDTALHIYIGGCTNKYVYNQQLTTSAVYTFARPE